MAQAMERLLATPTTNPIFPFNNDIVPVIEKPAARQVKEKLDLGGQGP